MTHPCPGAAAGGAAGVAQLGWGCSRIRISSSQRQAPGRRIAELPTFPFSPACLRKHPGPHPLKLDLSDGAIIAKLGRFTGLHPKAWSLLPPPQTGSSLDPLEFHSPCRQDPDTTFPFPVFPPLLLPSEHSDQTQPPPTPAIYFNCNIGRDGPLVAYVCNVHS